MSSILAFLKQNKFSAFLLLAVVLLTAKLLVPYRGSASFLPSNAPSRGGAEKAGFGGGVLAPMADEAVSQSSGTDRMVVKESNVSLLVRDVLETQNKIVSFAQDLGGYMVNMSTFSPEDGDSGNVSIRVPSTQLNRTLDYLRGLAVRVVSTNIRGRDITDQYVDIESRLQSLLDTKAKLEQIMAQAAAVNDIMEVQRQIMSLQYQIDSLKGQKDYLEKGAKTSLISISLATDELSLPYNPASPWRPEVVFKTAVRQLMLTLRGVGSLAIWILVYAVIWLPILSGIIFVPKLIKKYKKPTSGS